MSNASLATQSLETTSNHGDTGTANSSLGETHAVSPVERVENRLKLIFAIQSCLGGIVLSSGEETELIAVIAIFFAVFGYVFVDLLGLFALPPIAAYVAMTFVALYSVLQFKDMGAPGQQQMIAVGGLLVNVQSILMLQVKTRRIFEQLIIFSLLELIVAAVFNNAIYYAFVMIPMVLLAVMSLSLMSALVTWEGVESSSQPDAESAAIRVWSPSTTAAYDASVMRFPRMVLTMFGPAVLVVGLVFFYALPRIGRANRMNTGGAVSIGFSDSLQLGQIGRMLQNRELAMRVSLTPHQAIRPYYINDSLYLRGRVFENYVPGDPERVNYASWSSITVSESLGEKSVPPQFVPADPSDSELYDLVDVKVMTEPLSSMTLFMIAPYYRIGPGIGLTHDVSTWTTHRTNVATTSFPRMDYMFGSSAFKGGEQGRLLTPISHPLSSLAPATVLDSVDPSTDRKLALLEVEEILERYRELTLAFDEDEQPTAFTLGERLAQEVPEGERNPYSIALAFERYLQLSESFRYTINLDSKPLPGMDPIEQFLSVNKKGHCQYFAAALVMMLRAQGIPARIVAGFNSDEFNELGNYYMVRQLHAHVWVEALVPRESIPRELLNKSGYVPGQLPADEYWLRLDPTPAGGRENRSPPNGMNQVMDLAKNMWDEYVVDMDGPRQDKSLVGKQGKTPMSESYATFIDYLQIQISRIKNGELGGGAWASRDMFSVPAALLAIGMILTTVVLFRLRLPSWWRSRVQRKGSGVVAEPSIPFYAETLRQLGRLGMHRQAGQTPAEFTSEQTLPPQYSMFTEPLSTLTAAFYRYRFGNDQAARTSQPLEPQIESALEQVREQVDQLRGKQT